jgi:4-hydroxyphenylacetate 3-monooxygenase
MNYAGNHEDIRIQALWNARSSGTLDEMIGLAERCLADYDENGWRDLAWRDAGASLAEMPALGRAAE